MASVFYCDTDSDLWYTMAEEQNMKVIQMPYTIDGKEEFYDFGKNTDIEGFYKKMRAGSTAITSALNAEIYKEIFEPHFKKGEDILYVSFSSKMSATFNAMNDAVKELKAKYPSVRFERFDTLSISMGAGLQVYLASKVFNESKGDIDKTLEYLKSILYHVGALFIVDDLKYLARGGRLSPSKAKIANLFNVKPVLTIDDEGTLDLISKQSGSKKAMSYMISVFLEKYKNIDDAPIIILSADADEKSKELEARIKELQPDADIWMMPVGPVVGAHCGPGTIGLIFTSTTR